MDKEEAIKGFVPVSHLFDFEGKDPIITNKELDTMLEDEDVSMKTIVEQSERGDGVALIRHDYGLWIATYNDRGIYNVIEFYEDEVGKLKETIKEVKDGN